MKCSVKLLNGFSAFPGVERVGFESGVNSILCLQPVLYFVDLGCHQVLAYVKCSIWFDGNS